MPTDVLNPMVAVAEEMHSLANALVKRQLDDAAATELAAQLALLTASLQDIPVRSKGEARGPDGQVASATATFIEMKPDHFVDQLTANE